MPYSRQDQAVLISPGSSDTALALKKRSRRTVCSHDSPASTTQPCSQVLHPPVTQSETQKKPRGDQCRRRPIAGCHWTRPREAFTSQGGNHRHRRLHSHRHRDLAGMIRRSAGIFESCHHVRSAQFGMQDRTDCPLEVEDWCAWACYGGWLAFWLSN